MVEKLTRDLNVIQNSDIEVEIDPITADLNIIQKLDDEPNDVGGLSAQELKAKFDEAGNVIKTFINGSLIPQVKAETVSEAQREINEAKRQENEAQRQANETARQEAEEARVTWGQAWDAVEEARNVWEDYDPAKTYVPGNKVYWTGSSYVNKAPCTGVPPNVSEYWQMVAKRGATVGEGMTEDDADERYLQLSGGWMTGPMTVMDPELPGSPTPRRYLQPESITVTHLPNKTSYLIGEPFDPTGMTVEGTYADGKKERIVGYSGAVPNEIQPNTDKVIVSYIENRAIRAAELPLIQHCYLDSPFKKTTVPNNNTNQTWNPPVCADGVLVLAPYNDSGAAYSVDCGKTWTETSLPVSQPWDSPVYADGMWVIGPTHNVNSSVAAYSEDGGKTWVQASLPVSQAWGDPVYADGVWVMGPGATETNSAIAAYSVDGGKTWNKTFLPAAKAWGHPVYVDGVWLMSPGYANNYNNVAYSEDGGKTWSTKSLPISQKWVDHIIYGDGVLVLFPYGVNLTVAAYSEDGGKTWTASTLPISNTYKIPRYEGGSWLCEVGAYQSTKILISEDGKAWSTSTISFYPMSIPVYGGGTWIISMRGDYTSAAVTYSEDGGKTWRNSSLPVSQKWNMPVYADGVWVIVPDSYNNVSSSIAAYSEDGGKTWVQANLPVSRPWNRPVYADGILICIGGGSPTTVAAYSEDKGKNWIQEDLQSQNAWRQPLNCGGVWSLLPSSGQNAAYCLTYKVLKPLPGKEVDLSAPKPTLEDQVNALMAENAALAAAVERGLSL